MTSKLLLKGLAALSIAAVVAPMAVSAHGIEASGDVEAHADSGLHLGVFGLGGLHLGDRTDASTTVKVRGEGDRDRDRDTDGEHDGAKVGATSSAAVHITNQANRLQKAADFMTTVEGAVAAKAGASASTSATVAGFTTAIAGVNTNASAALAAAAQLGSTTNATITAQAQTDLKAARGFLNDARKALASLIRSVWSF